MGGLDDGRFGWWEGWMMGGLDDGRVRA